MDKHTPGPWITDGQFIKRGKTILAEAFTTKLAAEGMNEAPVNARLIAAAPDLLEALRLVCQMVVENGHDMTNRKDVSAALGIADAAIARATGETK